MLEPLGSLCGKGNGYGIVWGYLTAYRQIAAARGSQKPLIAYSAAAHVGLVPYLTRTNGVLCETGGFTSHLAQNCLVLAKPLVILMGKLPVEFLGKLARLNAADGSVTVFNDGEMVS